MTATVAPDAPVEVLEPWMRKRLHPLAAFDPTTGKLRAHVARPEGWPMPSGPLQPAAVLAPLVEREEGLTVLFTRRADGLRRHFGQIAFPGGRAEPGEAPWDTALREAEEEIGLAPNFVRVLGLGDPYETVTGFSIVPVVALVRAGFDLRPHEPEVAEVFESPFAFLMDPANHELRERDFGDGLRRSYYAVTHSERLIWGATAGMLRNLYERLFEAPASR